MLMPSGPVRIPYRLALLLSVTGALLPAPALANMGNTATTYGLLPLDVATAQGLSLFNSQVSATYYNPAYLARDSRGELTTALLHADHSLEVRQLRAASGVQRSGSVLNDTPSQQVLIGMKTDVSAMTRFNTPMYLGFMAGVEKYGQEMMAFSSETSQEGQFFNYGRQPLFLAIGGGMNLWRGVDVGLSTRVTLHATAKMRTWSTLGGRTSQEDMEVSAKPVLRPIVGVNVRWGDTFCQQTPCWMDRIETALVYKGYSNTRTKVDANAVIPNTIDEPGLRLAIETLDSFQPEIITAGLQYRLGERTRLGLTAEWQRWSRLGKELRKDTVKDQAMLDFDDIFVPRIGLEHQLNPGLALMAGVAWEKSPLKGRESLDVNYFDNDRVVIGLGASLQIDQPPVLAYPLRLELGYQYHHMDPRKFDLHWSGGGSANTWRETVEAEGDVHVFTGSMTIKF